METERPQPLLSAIDEFREALDRLIDEQKGLVLRCAPELIATEPPPLPPPPSTVYVPPAMGVRSEPDPHPARKLSPSHSHPVTARAPVVEPLAHDPSRPEDSRQRLDALAAKLLDRRQRHTTTDASAP